MRIFFFLILFSIEAFSQSPHFRAKADDLSVENRCEAYAPRFFTSSEISYFTVGVKGTKRAGMTEEVPVTRDEAKVLWRAISPSKQIRRSWKQAAHRQISNSEKLQNFYQILEHGKETRAARYNSEGEVLEVLAYFYLPMSETFLDMIEDHFGRALYNPEEFFITGGVSYYNDAGRTLGELDIVVGDHRDCSIFGIGEAKLGGKKGKAMRQLQRIRSYIRSL